MTTTSVAQPPVAMRVTDVRRWPAKGDAPSRSVVLLGEIGGSRLLPIWTGNWEGDAIAMLLEKVQVPRPLTHAFAARLLVAAGVQVKEVRVSRLTDETFYAQVVLRAGAAIEREVDARPSDAIALALETGAPIFVAAEVLAAIEAARAAAGDVPPAAPAIGAAQIVDELIERWPRGPKPTRSS